WGGDGLRRRYVHKALTALGAELRLWAHLVPTARTSPHQSGATCLAEPRCSAIIVLTGRTSHGVCTRLGCPMRIGRGSSHTSAYAWRVPTNWTEHQCPRVCLKSHSELFQDIHPQHAIKLQDRREIEYNGYDIG